MDRCQILVGDCLGRLRELPSDSVHCCVTSPPYWGLRDYGVGGQLGLEKTPEEYVDKMVGAFREVRRVLRKDGTLWVNLGDSYASGSGAVGNYPGGGTQGAKWAGQHPGRMKQNWLATRAGAAIGPAVQPNRMPITGRKPGDLVGIPWMVAFALQADGWFLRRDNIWWKPNPMPESVNGWRWERCRVKIKPQVRGTQASVGNSKRTRDMSNGQYLGSAEYEDCAGCDKCSQNGGMVLRKGAWRCTTSHEYVFQFSKSADYFCNAEAAKERATGGAHARGLGVNPKAKIPGKNSRAFQDRDPKHGSARKVKQNESFSAAVVGLVNERNLRSVWKVTTKPFRGAHFATFPPDLVRPIILAGTPVACCAECGAPWAPVIERGAPRLAQQRACGGDANGEYFGQATKDFGKAGAEDASAVKARILAGMVEKRVTGHRATCKCGADGVPATVLDPFGGSGTTGQVALELGRRAVLVELNPEYVPLIEQRTQTVGIAI